MSNKKRISRLIWKKYDLPIIIANWKKSVGLNKDPEIALKEFCTQRWAEHLGQFELGKIGDEIKVEID